VLNHSKKDSPTFHPKEKNYIDSSESDIFCRALAQKSPCCSAGLLWSVSHSSMKSHDVPSTTHYQVRTEPSTQPSAAPRFRSSTSLCRPPPISPNVWHSGAFQSQPPHVLDRPMRDRHPTPKDPKMHSDGLEVLADKERIRRARKLTYRLTKQKKKKKSTA